ncbi:MAG: hypothetical protein IT372_33570 [Polyangiaceae bacterium]|nr:hypothetical protein [Polyangiaceae bacterium]
MHTAANRSLLRSLAPLIAALSLALGPGCVRHAAKEATRGTLEALQQPRAGARGAQGERVERREEPAPAGGAPGVPPQQRLVGTIVRDAVKAGSTALSGSAGELQPFVARTSETAGSGLVTGALQQDRALLGFVDQGAGAAGRALAGAAISELTERTDGQIEGGAEQLARRAAAAAVGGATEQLAAQLGACPAGDPSCAYATIERLSRAAGQGAAAGIRHELAPWALALAFALGLLIAAPIGLAVGALISRRAAAPGR